MSHAAQDLNELQRLAQGGAGALTQHLLRELAMSIIAPGVTNVQDILSRSNLGLRGSGFSSEGGTHHAT